MYRKEFQTYDILSFVSLGTSILSLGLSTHSFITRPSVKELNQEYISLGFELARLEGDLQ